MRCYLECGSRNTQPSSRAFIVVGTNEYRCLGFCKNCPFKDNGKEINLSDGRVADIKKLLDSDDNKSFSCHKTVYNLDENMNPTKEQSPKMCYGAYKYLRDKGSPNIMMRIAYSMGIDSPRK